MDAMQGSCSSTTEWGEQRHAVELAKRSAVHHQNSCAPPKTGAPLGLQSCLPLHGASALPPSAACALHSLLDEAVLAGAAPNHRVVWVGQHEADGHDSQVLLHQSVEQNQWVERVKH